ncbi:hypothetical protein LTV02_17965 [Nocardia yamanashiensis]|uniref:hypothetical protein n=1 Tax=Nocardia yamanashiensis TaxID=209247 RepID=UPI001E33AAE3|nr:hypothetical protein [Nocardia yamanashiensis]UGT45158.1 hypothetical protein LTV02_17965 [Nocardia yamanashiensis]
MTTNSNSGRGIDWDGELQALMESSGIKLAELTRPNWKMRWRRRALGARAFGAAVVITLPLMWITVSSGAPAAAVVPLLIWLTGWIGYGVWVSAGHPDWSIIAHAIAGIVSAASHLVSRSYFARTRPARARWRAYRIARATAVKTA